MVGLEYSLSIIVNSAIQVTIMVGLRYSLSPLLLLFVKKNLNVTNYVIQFNQKLFDIFRLYFIISLRYLN